MYRPTRLYAIRLFYDLTKAYDVTNHDKWLDKLNSYGIRCKTNLWFKSYLTHWVQFVEINQTDHRNSIYNRYISFYRQITHGVPQGPILGPFLILLYTNVLPLNIHGAELVLFADDTNLTS